MYSFFFLFFCDLSVRMHICILLLLHSPWSNPVAQHSGYNIVGLIVLFHITFPKGQSLAY